LFDHLSRRKLVLIMKYGYFEGPKDNINTDKTKVVALEG